MNLFEIRPTDTHAKEVCKVGQGAECCRYLTMKATGWSCQKHTELRRYFDQRVAEGAMNARGDNCIGRAE